LERVTKMAYSIVTIYGMNDKIGNVSFYDSKQSEYSFNKPYSESTAETIDEEVRNIVSSSFQRTKDLLKSKRKELEVVAKELLEKEIIFQSDLERLIGKRPFEKQTTYQAFTNGQSDNEEVEISDEISEIKDNPKAENSTIDPDPKDNSIVDNNTNDLDPRVEENDSTKTQGIPKDQE